MLQLAHPNLRSISCKFVLLNPLRLLFFPAGDRSSKRAISRGPPLASVERVDITDEQETDDIEFTSFAIRRDS